MIECINKKCGHCENGKCKDEIYINASCKWVCKDRINPIHTPSYAEEQLNHAIEKEKRCYDKEYGENKNNQCTNTHKDFSCISGIKEPIDYESKYNKLKEKLEVSQSALKIIKAHVEAYEKEHTHLENFIQKQEKIICLNDEKIEKLNTDIKELEVEKQDIKIKKDLEIEALKEMIKKLVEFI